jgi:hypothetical protein
MKQGQAHHCQTSINREKPSRRSNGQILPASGTGKWLYRAARSCSLAARARPSLPTGVLSSRVADFRRQAVIIGLAIGLYLLQINRGLAEDHVDYGYENYREEDGRIGVDTQSLLFQKSITPWLSLQGQAVYDAISGATPTGAPPATDIKVLFPPPGPLNNTVPLVEMHDRRWAGVMDAMMTFGPHHITPQFAYSTESDYISYGGAINYSLDLNQKNTSLNAGWSHDWDTIYHNPRTYIVKNYQKNSDDILIGVSQLLGPKTILTGNFTFGNSHGYLADPYRGVLFDDYPQADLNNPSLFPENRPSFRQSYIGYITLLQYITPLHGSLEAAYRPYYDSFGVVSHTIDLSWHQKIGKLFLISPVFRYYHQTAAYFYATQFPGDPSNPFDPTPIPTYYSADYRLSKMETFTIGVEASARITDWFSLNLAYKRYDMRGLDGITSQSAYPKANIVTVGASLGF